MSLETVEETSPSNEDTRREKTLSVWGHGTPRGAVLPGPPIANVLALCGVVIGLSAVFCTWFRWDYSFGTWSTSLWDFLTREWFTVSNLADLGGLLFVSATLAALITQVSGLVQIAGLAMVFADFADRAAMGIGFYMGILSAALVIASIAFPVGPGFEAGPCSLRNRFSVFGRRKSQPDRKAVNERHSLRLRMGRLLRANGKWISLLVAVSIWFATVVVYENDFFRDDPLLTQVEGGFTADSFSFGGAVFHLSENLLLSLDDGENSVSWSLSNTELELGMWCVADLGYRNLGSLNVSLTALNHNGDEYLGPDDQLIVLARNGTSFEEDVVYSISLKYNKLVPLSGVIISFVFHDDVLDSWVSYRWSSTM